MKPVLIVEAGRNLEYHYSWVCGDLCCSGTESDYETLKVGDVLKFIVESDRLVIEGWFASGGQTGDGDKPMWVYPYQIKELIDEGVAKHIE